METTWDGATRSGSLNPEIVAIRDSVARAAKDYEWNYALDLLAEYPEHANCWRLDGKSFYTPLHQAAHGNASISVVQQLIDLGAWRTLQNARGERPVDVAARHGHTGLLAILGPLHRQHIPVGILLKIQSHFHTVIRGRAGRLVDEHSLRLPELEVLLELDEPRMWFPVPGMYGGFSYRLESVGVDAKLMVESWCRVVEGSGERHEITSAGTQLVDEGFV